MSERELPVVRTQEDWRPDSLLCRRFNVPDPYKGTAAKLQPPQDRIDYLALPETQRAAAYAASLPDFLKPQASDATRRSSTYARDGPSITRDMNVARDVDLQQSSGALPGPPVRSTSAARGAAYATPSATQLLLPPAQPGVVDASGHAAAAMVPDADDFLAQMEASGELQPMSASVPDAAVARLDAAALAEKPMDLFHAIFGAEDDEDEESDEDGAAPAPVSLPTSTGADAGIAGVDEGSGEGERGAQRERERGAQRERTRVPDRKQHHTDLGAALLQVQSVMARQAAGSRSAGAGAEVGPQRAHMPGVGRAGSGASSDDDEDGSASPPGPRRVGEREGASGQGEARGVEKKVLSREERLEEALRVVRNRDSRQALTTREIDEILRSVKKDGKKSKKHKHKEKSRDRAKESKHSSSKSKKSKRSHRDLD